MEKIVPFVAKVSIVKTRTNHEKNYFVYRMNIPTEVAKELSLQNNDYLFLRCMKAKWHHMIDWKEMSQTWQMLPDHLKKEIELSGLAVPLEKLKMPKGMISATSSISVSELPITTVTRHTELEEIPQVIG